MALLRMPQLERSSYALEHFLKPVSYTHLFPFLLPIFTQFDHLQSLFLGSIGGGLAAVATTAAFLLSLIHIYTCSSTLPCVPQSRL